MSSLRQVYELAKRDFVQRAKSRAFLITMLVTVGLVLAIGPLIALASNDPDPSVVGIVGSGPEGIHAAVVESADMLGVEVVTEIYPSEAAAMAELGDGRADVLVIDGEYLVWRQAAIPRLAAAITAAFSRLEREKTAEGLGLSAEDLAELLAPTAFTDQLLEEPDPEEEPRQAAAYAGLMVLYISILMFGQFVLMGVMEEKQNRVVEVVLSRVRPTQILTGKVIGVGLLGLIQILALGGAALFMVTVIDIADVDLSAIGIEVFLWVLFWYLLGYAFYSMLYGALGATVSRQEDMQGAVMIPVLMIVPGFFFGQVATQSPDAAIARIGSLVPLWSPMVMPVRSAVGDVPAWEIALSVLLVVAGIYALVRLGGRIYTGAILKIGTKVRLKEAWRAAKS
jgi:ABC-2 type transport system permease protein